MAKKIEDELVELGVAIVKFMGDRLSVDTGKFKGGFTIDVTSKQGKQTLSIYNEEDYGDYLNYGTKPHMPPVDAIRGWAERKGISPWALAMHIKKFGTKPHRFMPEDSEVANIVAHLDLSEYLYNKIDEKINPKR